MTYTEGYTRVPRSGVLTLAVAILGVLCASAGLGAAVGLDPADKQAVRTAMGNLSVPFFANQGQADERVAFYARTFSGTVFVTKAGEIVYSLPGSRSGSIGKAKDPECESSQQGWSLVERMLGGRPAPRAGEKGPTNISIFHGNDPGKWRSSIATYEGVELGEVWPGVQMKLMVHGDNVEKLFVIQPGASSEGIRIGVYGAGCLEAGEAGSLQVRTGPGQVRLTGPVAWQDGPDGPVPVEVAYQVHGDEYGLRLGEYDTSLPVVIDPLMQATYLGGSGDDRGYDIAIHPSTGDVYVAGGSGSSNFPGTTGGAQATHGGAHDAFVARLASNLTSLTQATYLGGSSIDYGTSIAINPSSGDVYVTGYTDSMNFPGTTGGAQAAHGPGLEDAFVARLTSDLSCVPSITDQPRSQTIGSGSTAILTVVAPGMVPLIYQYQWYQGTSGDTSNPIAGATHDSFTTPALTSTTSYWVRVTNACGSTDSATAAITIAAGCVGARIDTNPANQTIDSGGSATLTVVANGSAPLQYQWYQGSSSDTSTPVGVDSNSFTTPALSSATSYWVRVANACGIADSSAAIVTVTSTSGPTIMRIRPRGARPGMHITITGTGFSKTAELNVAYVAAIRSSVTKATTTRLTTKVPRKCPKGSVSVYVVVNGRQSNTVLYKVK